MHRLYIFIFGLIALAALIIGLALAEQITLSTYYPAPYGVYKEFTTTSKTTLATNPSGTDSNALVGIGTTNPTANLEIYDANTQGKIVVSGVSDSGATYSALYLDDEDSSSAQNSWVIGYRKDIGLGTEKSLVFGRYKEDGTNFIPMMIKPNGNVGIGTISPQTHRGLSIKGHIWASDGDIPTPGSGHEAFVMYKPDNNTDPVSKFYFRKGTGPNLGSQSNPGVDLMTLDNGGNLWIAGKLSQPGCPDYSNITPLEFIRQSINKTEHITQAEVDALMRIVIEQDEQIRKLARDVKALKARNSK